MTTTEVQPFTVNDLRVLAPLVIAVERNARVTWATDGLLSGVRSEGVLRHFTDERGYFDTSTDVRALFLWISGVTETWLPVSLAMELFRHGLLRIED